MAKVFGGCITHHDNKVVVVQLMRLLLSVASTLSSPEGKRRSVR